MCPGSTPGTVAIYDLVMKDYYAIALGELGWVEITLWYRCDKDGYNFSHLEEGHSEGISPKPRSTMQKKSWSGVRWSKKIWYAYYSELISVLPEQ